MLRTVYYPSISFGVSKGIAGVLVFFVSAVFHELLVGVPLRMNSFPYWSFLGIMGQVSHQESGPARQDHGTLSLSIEMFI